MASGWPVWVDSEADAIRTAGRWRRIRTLDGQGPQFWTDDGQSVVSFASNDYLGLSAHPQVGAAARDAIDRWGSGSGSSRLIVGSRPAHRELEQALADWRGTEAALVLPTGYQANLAALTTFGAGARIVSDELNHASIIDGCRLARAEIAVYRHGDVDQAEQLVRSAPGRVLVVTDTVFSMDGDVAPVTELSSVCARHGALLVLDDAHAVFDAPALDPAAACVRVGTLSKALGSQGGYIAAAGAYVDLLVNRARSMIFTTGLAPSCAAAAAAAVAICRSDEGDQLRQALRTHVDAIRPGHPSPVIPVILGGESAAVQAADRLLEAGLLVPAIRPPTVPPGTCRLRASLCATHLDKDVARLAAALSELTPQ
jgi:8-amino-7-oxononanoate synthase